MAESSRVEALRTALPQRRKTASLWADALYRLSRNKAAILGGDSGHSVDTYCYLCPLHRALSVRCTGPECRQRDPDLDAGNLPDDEILRGHLG